MDESHFTRSGQRKLIDLPLKRRRKKKPLQDDASTSGCTSNVAPTAALSSRKMQEVIDREKSKAELKIAELTKERDELLEKLSLAKRNVGPVMTDSYTEPSSTDSSSSSSTSRSTSSDSSTSTEKHKKNRKGKNKKEKKRKEKCKRRVRRDIKLRKYVKEQETLMKLSEGIEQF
ncbi:corepressor interacting with RBPJ 1-like [Triplophysa rosa]|uniref:Uncharacterized protein n=1 Tax=Triplophysa rosa TaxID=992332 RepID=A0A9W7WRQ7_TRIRA|nr:corepressor interacting with RBPJ 1-like [Triplophysa rosa]KAI7807330.1 hypothetical protein IRJ41_002015 [Triplophysa rosa]